MLKISPLFSGSKGNCTLVQSATTNILLDVGYGFRSTVKALAARNLAATDINAIIITHEHSDHVCALQQWTAHYSTTVYAPEVIVREIELRVPSTQVVPITGSFVVGDVALEVYECSHDVRCCFGYRFSNGGSYFACVTDTGVVTSELVDFFTPCSTIMLESNHDEDMLLKGPYNYALKRRILSNYGHLSNAQAASLLKQLVGSNIKNVILAHLSQTNNTRELAFSSAVNALAECGVVEGKDIKVFVADQCANEVTICID